ncbi:zinc-binding protein A33-like [Alligator sinensis]|uniref:Zinc-binding protein A33-like n=1 Tax=Alligator sinensis TaxID=38654 RepID=A0A3Q0GGB9_ALLSI|nr:zinc-binding protein A33-like [Alligator sinensis]
MEALKKDPEEQGGGKRVEDIVSEFLEAEEEAEKLCCHYKEGIQAVQMSLESLRKKVMGQFKEMHNILYAEEQSVMAKISQEEEQVVGGLEYRLKKITERAANVLEIVDYLGQVRECDEHLADVAGSQVDQFKAELKEHTEELSLSKPAGLCSPPLMYAICRRMLRQAMQSALESLTLDPHTAHAHLDLSEDLKAVKLGHRSQTIPKDPQRFHPCLYVLCSQGFCSGRHYWEVSVGNKSNWVVEVASHRVNRQATEDLIPENGYWALRKLPGDHYYALLSPPDRLTLDTRPRRVGVCLDYECGRVGFYDAHGMAKICLLQGHFQGMLYPFLCPGLVLSEQDHEPLRLCD